MGREMTDTDAELAFRYLRDPLRSRLIHESLTAVHEQWLAERPEEYSDVASHVETVVGGTGVDVLDDESPFTGDGVEASLTVDTDENAETIRNLARDYREELRTRLKQEAAQTRYSPREFVALVLDAELTESEAAELMDITVGNFRGKKGAIRRKQQTAEQTLSLMRSMQM